MKKRYIVSCRRPVRTAGRNRSKTANILRDGTVWDPI